jgi:hypothetical protein
MLTAVEHGCCAKGLAYEISSNSYTYNYFRYDWCRYVQQEHLSVSCLPALLQTHALGSSISVETAAARDMHKQTFS